MKHLLVALLATASVFTFAAPTSEPPLASKVYEWNDLEVESIPNGERRCVFDGPTALAERIHCHITTLNAGENSGDPALHLNEEVIIIKEGRVEVSCNGRLSEVGPGSVLYFAPNSVTRLRNIGEGTATYFVLYRYGPKASD